MAIVAMSRVLPTHVDVQDLLLEGNLLELG